MPFAKVQFSRALGLSSREESNLLYYLKTAAQCRRGLIHHRRARKLSQQCAQKVYTLEVSLAKWSQNPSLLYRIFRRYPDHRKVVRRLLTFLSLSRRSYERDAIVLGFLLSLSVCAERFPLTFQAALQVLLKGRHPHADKMAKYFIRHNFRNRRIPYSSSDLRRWLAKVVFSTRSLHVHLPLIARLLWIPFPLKVLQLLIWGYVPPTNPSAEILRERYGSRMTFVLPLDYAHLTSLISHSLRVAQPNQLDILLFETFMEHLVNSPHYLYAISLFEILRNLNLHNRLSMFFHLILVDKLVKTQNLEQAMQVYESILHTASTEALDNPENHTPENIHIAVTQQIPTLLCGILRGLREFGRQEEYIVDLLIRLPVDVITADAALTVEALRYAAFAQNRTLVRSLLTALSYPLYDEDYVPNEDPPLAHHSFSPDIWSAILYAHTQLGYINSSRYVLQSMVAGGYQPRNQDMSTIIAGTAKIDLNTAYDMAVQLSESIDHEAYETILEVALERGDQRIVEWAKAQVAYEGTPGPVILEEDQSLHPPSFEMTSALSDAMADASIPTCTPRAQGILIKHISRKEGLAPAILMLLSSRGEMRRDVYSTLFEVACQGGRWKYAALIAEEMRRRGWMPRDYRGVKRDVRRENDKRSKERVTGRYVA